jgi:hypothetical protein
MLVDAALGMSAVLDPVYEPAECDVQRMHGDARGSADIGIDGVRRCGVIHEIGQAGLFGGLLRGSTVSYPQEPGPDFRG